MLHNTGSTTLTNSTYYGATMDGIKNNLAIVLTAFNTGKALEVTYDDSDGNCPVESIKLLSTY